MMTISVGFTAGAALGGFMARLMFPPSGGDPCFCSAAQYRSSFRWRCCRPPRVTPVSGCPAAPARLTRLLVEEAGPDAARGRFNRVCRAPGKQRGRTGRPPVQGRARDSDGPIGTFGPAAAARRDCWQAGAGCQSRPIAGSRGGTRLPVAPRVARSELARLATDR